MSVSGGGAGGDTTDDEDASGLLGRFVSFTGGDSFLTMPSIEIRLFDLLKAIIGGVIFAFVDVAIRLVGLPFRVLTAVFEGLSSFLVQLIRRLFGVSGAFEVAFLAARADLIGTGLAAIVLAALSIAAASYAWGVVTSYVAE